MSKCILSYIVVEAVANHLPGHLDLTFRPSKLILDHKLNKSTCRSCNELAGMQAHLAAAMT